MKWDGLFGTWTFILIGAGMGKAIKNFKTVTEEEFLDLIPMYIHEANTARKLIKKKQEEEKEKSRIILLN